MLFFKTPISHLTSRRLKIKLGLRKSCCSYPVERCFRLFLWSQLHPLCRTLCGLVVWELPVPLLYLYISTSTPETTQRLTFDIWCSISALCLACLCIRGFDWWQQSVCLWIYAYTCWRGLLLVNISLDATRVPAWGLAIVSLVLAELVRWVSTRCWRSFLAPGDLFVFKGLEVKPKRVGGYFHSAHSSRRWRNCFGISAPCNLEITWKILKLFSHVCVFLHFTNWSFDKRILWTKIVTRAPSFSSILIIKACLHTSLTESPRIHSLIAFL